MSKAIPGTACPLCDPQHFDALHVQVPAAVLCKAHAGHPLGEWMIKSGFTRHQSWSEVLTIVFTGKAIALSFKPERPWVALDLKDAEQFLQAFTLALIYLRKAHYFHERS
jgi:hypothetical protein